jgi:hypothetical protein
MMADPFKDRRIRQIISQISGDTIKELRDFKRYCDNHKTKLNIIRRFIVYLNTTHWNYLKREIRKLKKLSFLDLRRESKDKKYDQDSIDLIKKAIEQSPENSKLRERLEYVLRLMEVLNLVYTRLNNILLGQIEWVEKNENAVLENYRLFQQFVELIREEGKLLFEHNLSGDKNEKDLLDEIYTQILPLKERITLKQKLSGGIVGNVWRYNILGWGDIVIKTYGGGRKWTKEMAQARAEIQREYYEFLRSKGVPVPSKGQIYVLSEYEKRELEKGIFPTGYFKKVTIQRFIGIDGDTFLENEQNTEKIRVVFTKMLHALFLARQNEPQISHWKGDFKPINFCIIGNLNVIYIDIDPPGFTPDETPNLGFEIHPNRMTREEKLKLLNVLWSHLNMHERKDLLFRLETTNGMFMHLIEWAVVARPDLEKFLLDIAFGFLQKYRPNVYRFMRKHVRTLNYKRNLQKWGKIRLERK